MTEAERVDKARKVVARVAQKLIRMLPPESAIEALTEIEIDVLTFSEDLRDAIAKGQEEPEPEARKEGQIPFGESINVICGIIDKMPGTFTIPVVLAEIRKTYPLAKRTTLHPRFMDLVANGTIEIVRPGTQGSTKSPTIYQKKPKEAVAVPLVGSGEIF